MANKKLDIRKLTITGMLAALSTVLMFLSFSVPFMPSYIKFDFSELPALIAAFSLGPVSGILVCLVKNLVNLLFTSTGGVGELCNFLIGALFVLPAGLIYNKSKTKKSAVLGAIVGAVIMAVASLFVNYYIIYPIYQKFMPMEAIIGSYKALLPSVDNLWEALTIFNMPFTFLKGMMSVIITVLIYKKISPIIKGKGKK